MSGRASRQILVYAVVLVALGYPLGIYMARVYTAAQQSVDGRSSAASSACSGRDASQRAGLEEYGKSVIVFSVAFCVFLYGMLRLQGHLFLNPDHLPAVPCDIALNTTASFVTNTNWQYYGGEYDDVVPQPDGRARGAALRLRRRSGWPCVAAVMRGIARRAAESGSATSGATSTARSSTSCCRSRSSSP